MDDKKDLRKRIVPEDDLEMDEIAKEAARIEKEKQFKAASQEKQKGIIEQFRKANAYLNPKEGEVIETHIGEDGKEYDQYGNVVVRNSLGQIIPQEIFDQIELSLAEKADNLEEAREEVIDEAADERDDDGFEEANVDNESSEEKEKRKGKIGKAATVGILSVLIALGAQGIYEFTNEDSFTMKNIIHKYGIEEKVPEIPNVQIGDPNDLSNHAIIINEPTPTPEGEVIEGTTVEEEAPVISNNDIETTPSVTEAPVVTPKPEVTVVAQVDNATLEVGEEAPVVGNAATIIDAEAPVGQKPVQVEDAALEIDEEAPLVKGEEDVR